MAKEGRPTKYTKELGDLICDLIANSDRGLRSICQEVSIVPSTVFTWIQNYPDFQKQYARARELQADFLAEQILEISDYSANDTIHTDKGEIPDHEWISRSRLRVDSRKWLASKLAPKKYGDKVDMNVAVTKIGKDLFNEQWED